MQQKKTVVSRRSRNDKYLCLRGRGRSVVRRRQIILTEDSCRKKRLVMYYTVFVKLQQCKIDRGKSNCVSPPLVPTSQTQANTNAKTCREKLSYTRKEGISTNVLLPINPLWSFGILKEKQRRKQTMHQIQHLPHGSMPVCRVEGDVSESYHVCEAPHDMLLVLILRPFLGAQQDRNLYDF